MINIQEAQAAKNMTHHLPEMYLLNIKYLQAVKQPIVYYYKDNSKKLYPTDLQRGCLIVFILTLGLLGFLKDVGAILQDGAIMKRLNPPQIIILAPSYKKVKIFSKLKKDKWLQICKDFKWTNKEQ